MKVFRTHHFIFTLMCIFPKGETTPLWKQVLILIFGIIIPTSVLWGFAASFVYVLKFANVDLEESVKTVFQIAAYVNVSYMMIIAFLKRDKIINIFNRFQHIYDNSKSEDCCKVTGRFII